MNLRSEINFSGLFYWIDLTSVGNGYRLCSNNRRNNMNTRDKDALIVLAIIIIGAISFYISQVTKRPLAGTIERQHPAVIKRGKG